ncbi:MAG: hypothetical protein V1773_15325 [bacterium]
MSWFCGVIGNFNKNDTDYFEDFRTNTSKNICKENFYLLIGQKDINICFKAKTADEGFCISGIGLEKTERGFKLLTSETWSNFCTSIEGVDLPDGHYCGVIWKNNKITFFNDPLGIKYIYILEKNNKVYFSNRLDILTKTITKFSIDLNELMPAWFLTAKTSTKSLITNITRLNGIFEFINGKSVKNLQHNWLPNFTNKATVLDFNITLKNILQLFINNNKDLYLGFTSGLDSRLLLSYLLKNKENNWGTFTFGNNELPDVKYSKIISDKLNFRHLIYDYEVPSTDQLISELTKYICYTGTSIPISEMIQFGMHKHFADNNKLMVDGSYGEIYRRQMLNKLLLLGKNDLLNKDSQNISKYVKSSRPNIFNTDFASIINNSINASILEIFDLLPPVQELGFENWLDLYAIKVKLPNTTALSQQCLDSICTAYTAFIQPSLLNIGLLLPFKERKNGKMFRSLIKQNSPELTKFPLVKNQAAYPYRFGNKASWLWTKAKGKIVPPYKWNLNIQVLDLLKGYINDKIDSSIVKQNNIYNHQLIKQAVEEYYKGNTSYAEIVEWFITFELWQDSLRK